MLKMLGRHVAQAVGFMHASGLHSGQHYTRPVMVSDAGYTLSLHSILLKLNCDPVIWTQP